MRFSEEPTLASSAPSPTRLTTCESGHMDRLLYLYVYNLYVIFPSIKVPPWLRTFTQYLIQGLDVMDTLSF